MVPQTISSGCLIGGADVIDGDTAPSVDDIGDEDEGNSSLAPSVDSVLLMGSSRRREEEFGPVLVGVTRIDVLIL